MQVDPVRRDAIYRPLFDALTVAGITAEWEYLRDFDYLICFSRVGSRTAYPRNRSVLCLNRLEAGWFISLHPHGYRFTAHDSVGVAVMISLIRALNCGELDAEFPAIVQLHGLEVVSYAEFRQREFNDRRRRWVTCGWGSMNDIESERVYRKLQARFAGDLQRLRPSQPYAFWRVPKKLFQNRASRERRERALSLLLFDAVRRLVAPNDFLYAMDVNHRCYRFYPCRGVREPYYDFWPLSFWPDGNSCYFIAPDCQWGVFSMF
ncbi:MAG TPA: DUF2716 domain-containing protein, partial [Pirellulales bacterium]